MQSQTSSSGSTPASTPLQKSPSAAAASPARAKTPATNAMPAVADDGDRIEKEWVSKIRETVAKTAHDPYELSRQFTQIKADYMQKRYGKTIKVEK